MVNVLVIHEFLHEAKEIEHYITSCYGNPNMNVCVDVSKNELMNVIDQIGETIDVCFTKVKMKNISGIQIAPKLREKNASVKIVFISDTDEYAMDAWQCGINDYLLEPITMEKIRNSICNI